MRPDPGPPTRSCAAPQPGWQRKSFVWVAASRRRSGVGQVRIGQHPIPTRHPQYSRWRGRGREVSACGHLSGHAWRIPSGPRGRSVARTATPDSAEESTAHCSPDGHARPNCLAAVPAALRAAHRSDQEFPPEPSAIFGAETARPFGATRGLRPLDPHPSTRCARSGQGKVKKSKGQRVTGEVHGQPTATPHENRRSSAGSRERTSGGTPSGSTRRC